VSAVVALGALEDKRAVQPLIAMLKDEKDFIRSTAVIALGRVGSRQAVKPLIDALNSEAENVRRSAAFALGDLGDIRALPGLERLAENDPDAHVREYAIASLDSLAWSFADAGVHLEKAESIARKTLLNEPNNATFHDTLGWVLYKRGEYREAVAALEKAVALGDYLASAHYHLGLTYVKTDNLEKALDAFETACSLDKSYQETAKTDSALDGIRNNLEFQRLVSQ